ncbi:MAG: F0F1 ATP synthase subunit delta [Actinomycetota bacterium]|nr:F0F1 ATP synthase subunit delta [Actinomycetota bacterium]
MLPKLEGYAAALLGALDDATLTRVVSELSSLERAVLAQPELRGMLSDTSLTGVVRGQVLAELLDTKVHPETRRVAVYAAVAAPAQEVASAIGELAQSALVLEETGALHPRSLGLLAARRRVAGYADALLEGVATEDFARIEEELFRWARTVEENLELRRVLLDRDAALASRRGVVQQLLADKVAPVTLRLAYYVIEGGRPRDVVGTLDFLVEYVAQARNWRVARVYTARALDDASQADLVRSLVALTGTNVELQIAEEADLLGGVVVEVGDVRLDASTRGRLAALHDSVSAGHFYESALTRND